MPREDRSSHEKTSQRSTHPESGPPPCGAVHDGDPFFGLVCTREAGHEFMHRAEYGEDHEWTWEPGTPEVEQQRRENVARRKEREAWTRFEETRAANEAAEKEWLDQKRALDAVSVQRFPREEELTYALGATCGGCGAPLAYWTNVAHGGGAWTCADVLLGRVGTPDDKALLVERSMFSGPIPDPPPGKVLHDRLPFAFWKVKSDPTRTTR